MAIKSFDPDSSKEGWGTLTLDDGRVAYDYYPSFYKESSSGNPAKKIQEESTAIAESVIEPVSRSDERLAQNDSSVYGTSETPGVSDLQSSMDAQQSSTVDVPPPPVADPNDSPALQEAKTAAHQAGSLLQSGKSKSYSRNVTPGRPIAGVQNQIQNERLATDAAYKENSRLGEDKDKKIAQGFDTQLRALTSEKVSKDANVFSMDQRIQQNKKDLDKVQLEMDNMDPVDPDRYIKNMSAGSKVAATLLAGVFGALGNIGTRPQENQFLKAFNDRIDADIKVQEDEVKAGRTSKGNRIAAYVALGASLRDAKILAQRDAYEAGRKWSEVYAAKNAASGEHARNADAMNNSLRLEAARRENEQIAQTEDRISNSFSEGQTFMDPAAIKQSGDPARREMYQREVDDANQISNMVGRRLSPAQVKEIRANAETIGKADQELASYAQSYINYVNSLGAEINNNTLEITKWPDDLAGTGPGGRLWEALPGKQPVMDSKNQLVEQITSDTTGAAATIRQDAHFRDFSGGGNWTESRVKNTTEQLGRMIRAQREAVRKRDPDAAIYYDNRNGITGYSRKSGNGPKTDAPIQE